MKQCQSWIVRIWGVRGSAPIPAANFLEYGGNTSCVSVDCGGELVIFDAGSGIIRLGNMLTGCSKYGQIHILISHMHLDHTTGLAGFQPLHDPETHIHLYGEARECMSFQQQLERLIGPPYWPLSLGDFQARIVVHECAPGEKFQLTEGLSVCTLRGEHPNQSLLYRLEGMGKRLVYALDCELQGDMASRLTNFADNADLLIWDGTFAPSDLREGWGHSTWEQGAAVRSSSGAKMALMTHFSCAYTDDFLREQEWRVREQDSAVRFAKEGMEILL